MKIDFVKKNLSYKELEEIFKDISYVKLALLFGSRATKKHNSFSDYDIAVLTDSKDTWEFGRYWVDIATKLGIGEDDLDLIDLKKVNSFLLKNIKEKYIVIKGSEDEFLRLFGNK